MIPSAALRTVSKHPVLVWRCAQPWLAVSSAVHGGGIGRRNWVLNATVESDYHRPDPDAHISAMATELGLTGPGTGMLTAVDVRHEVTALDGGVSATVTTGVGQPVQAAEMADPKTTDPKTAEPETIGPGTTGRKPGTINAVCWSPVRLLDAALVNAVATVAEAKAQALGEAGVAGTGTATDATVVLCPADGTAETYGGPRSFIGAKLARAMRDAVLAGLRIGGSWDSRPGAP